MKILEQYFEALRTQNWESLASCLADEVHRIGPNLDVVRGKQAYIDFLAGVIPTLRNYELKVSRIRAMEGRSALVEPSDSLDMDGARGTFSEALLFDFDDAGLIARVDIYIKQPPTGEPDR